MWLRVPEDGQDGFYLAGEMAPPGLYQRVDSGEPVRLASPGRLPASFDGRVACYTLLQLMGEAASDNNAGAKSRG